MLLVIKHQMNERPAVTVGVFPSDRLNRTDDLKVGVTTGKPIQYYGRVRVSSVRGSVCSDQASQCPPLSRLLATFG